MINKSYVIEFLIFLMFQNFTFKSKRKSNLNDNEKFQSLDNIVFLYFK